MIRVNNAGNADLWESWDWLSEYLAQQLQRGEIAIVLGAGASMAFGLPSWPALTMALTSAAGVSAAPGLSDEEAAELVWDAVGRDEKAFARRVSEALYSGFSLDLSELHANSLVAALGTLALPSRSGGVRQVVSFNFDDLLESYLRRIGFMVASIAEVPAVSSLADVVVLHPHGLLGVDGTIAGHLVFTASSYDRVVGDVRQWMYRRLVDVLTSHTCIFIGLSGQDNNLMSALQEVASAHPHVKERRAYWGVRFTQEDDIRIARWEAKGVYNQIVKSWEELPSRLFAIRERSAAAVMSPNW